MKKRLFIALVAAAAILSVPILAMLYSAKSIENMKIGEVSLSTIPDGVYSGKEEYMGFTCYAEVAVRGHRIESVKLQEERGGRWVEKAKEVGERVVEKQSLQVDAVTGATVTSKAMLKAIENALKGNNAGPR